MLPCALTGPDPAESVPPGQTQTQHANYRSGIDPYMSNPSPAQWLNPAVFVAPAYGNTGRNAFRGPGLWRMDMGLTEKIRMSKRINLEFRAGAFNRFHRAQFGNPANNISNGTLWRILVTANDGSTGTGTSR